MPGTIRMESSTLRATMQVRCAGEWVTLRKVEFGRVIVAETTDGRRLSFNRYDEVEVMSRNNRTPALTAV